MCEMIYQIIGLWIYICVCPFKNRVEFDGKVRQFFAFQYQYFYIVCWLSPIIIYHVQRKSRQNDIDVPWHIYSNTFNPHLCTILALAKYLFYTGKINFEGKLFPGEFQFEMFLNIFCKAIHENSEEFNRLEVQFGYIESYYTHKEKMTLVSSGCTIFPPMSYICLWACWSIVPVKDICIHKKRLTTSLLAGASLAFHPQFRDLPCHLHILILQNFLLAQIII